MRVIAGEFRSRKLKSVPGNMVRPTPDRLRESLFSILAPRLPGSIFLDAYAGSGAVGIEAFSRGAKRVILIERQAAALEVIRENVKLLGIHESVKVVRGQASTQIPNYPADIAFVDPPYELLTEYRASLAALSAVRCPLVIAQHASRVPMEDYYGDLRKTRIVKQGDNSLSFFELGEITAPPA